MVADVVESNTKSCGQNSMYKAHFMYWQQKNTWKIGLKDWKMFRTGNILSLLSIMTIISQECIIGIPIHMLGQHIVTCIRGLIQGHITQIRSWQSFSVKGQNSNYFRLCRPYAISTAHFILQSCKIFISVPVQKEAQVYRPWFGSWTTVWQTLRTVLWSVQV